jgi:hypothetical protein
MASAAGADPNNRRAALSARPASLTNPSSAMVHSIAERTWCRPVTTKAIRVRRGHG